MAVVTYKHPATGQIRKFNDDDAVRVAALEKLGFVAWTVKDVEDEQSLGVTYETVTPAKQPTEPPALPKLTKPVPPGPTRDTSPTAPPITMSTDPEEAQSKGEKK